MQLDEIHVHVIITFSTREKFGLDEVSMHVLFEALLLSPLPPPLSLFPPPPSLPLSLPPDTYQTCVLTSDLLLERVPVKLSSLPYLLMALYCRRRHGRRSCGRYKQNFSV